MFDMQISNSILINRFMLKVMEVISYQVNPEYARLTELVPGLFICGVSDLNQQNIEKNGITMIVNATHEVPNIKTLGNIPRMKLWIDDTSEFDIYPHLDPVSDQIEAIIADGGAVLVHCVAGVSRSATICLAFLTKYRCETLREAYFLMHSKRPLVRPNIGFWKQLIRFEQEIKGGPASVGMVYDEAQTDHMLPDVYLDQSTQRMQPLWMTLLVVGVVLLFLSVFVHAFPAFHFFELKLNFPFPSLIHRNDTHRVNRKTSLYLKFIIFFFGLQGIQHAVKTENRLVMISKMIFSPPLLSLEYSLP
uniref:Protein-tyrosine-phosphatase n=1 Tax=Elaeophora elaphi TaxID=1147741 RepID=A0A158Q7C2_9BILA